MAGPLLADRVRETSTTTGTGTLVLAGAAAGFRTFAAAIGAGNTCYYCIQAVDGGGAPNGDWEVGLGTVGSGSLSRDAVLESTNSDQLVNFGSGTKDVFVTAPAAILQSGLLTYTHTQSVAGTTWTVTHNLGRRPSVTVVDSAGTRVNGTVSYLSDNQLTITFANGFAGSCYLN